MELIFVILGIIATSFTFGAWQKSWQAGVFMWCFLFILIQILRL